MIWSHRAETRQSDRGVFLFLTLTIWECCFKPHTEASEKMTIGPFLSTLWRVFDNLVGGSNFYCERSRFLGMCLLKFWSMVNPWPLASWERIFWEIPPESKSWEASALRDLNSTEPATFQLGRILLSFRLLPTSKSVESVHHYILDSPHFETFISWDGGHHRFFLSQFYEVISF